MSNLYGTSQIASVEEIGNSDALFEAFLIDDIMRGSSDDIKNFCESEEAQILVEKQVLNKPTIHRMSKADDYKRRVKLASYQLAKDANDPLWTRLVKYQKLKKLQRLLRRITSRKLSLLRLQHLREEHSLHTNYEKRFPLACNIARGILIKIYGNWDA